MTERAQVREIKKIAKSKPVEHGLPFSTWSLSELAEFLVAEGVVDDVSREGIRVLLCDEGVSFQRIKTWKASGDPHYAVKKEQGSMIRRSIIWRNRHADDTRLVRSSPGPTCPDHRPPERPVLSPRSWS